MSFASRLRQRIREADTPFFRFLKSAANAILYPPGVRIPDGMKFLFRPLYQLHYAVIVFFRLIVTYLYRHPLFQSRCRVVGKRLVLNGKMPFIVGPVVIELGDDVVLWGNVSVISGGRVAEPLLKIGDRTQIGYNTILSIAKEVVIEDDVIVSYDCRVSDTDGHPRQADLRANKVPPEDKDVRPVRIGRGAFIGNGCHIMKGVTIGDGAIVSANSVVATNVPAYAIAMGNPAEVIFPGGGKPKDKSWMRRPSSDAGRDAGPAGDGRAPR